MAITRISAHRLRKAGYSFVATSHHLTNAFACPSHEVQKTAIDHRALQKYLAYDEHRRGHSVTTIRQADNPSHQLHVKLGPGGMMGSRRAPDDFNATFVKSVQKWNLSLAKHCMPLLATHSFDGTKHDLSLAVYVDDISKLLPVPDHLCNTAHKLAKFSNYK